MEELWTKLGQRNTRDKAEHQGSSQFLGKVTKCVNQTSVDFRGQKAIAPWEQKRICWFLQLRLFPGWLTDWRWGCHPWCPFWQWAPPELFPTPSISYLRLRFTPSPQGHGREHGYWQHKCHSLPTRNFFFRLSMSDSGRLSIWLCLGHYPPWITRFAWWLVDGIIIIFLVPSFIWELIQNIPGKWILILPSSSSSSWLIWRWCSWLTLFAISDYAQPIMSIILLRISFDETFQMFFGKSTSEVVVVLLLLLSMSMKPLWKIPAFPSLDSFLEKLFRIGSIHDSVFYWVDFRTCFFFFCPPLPQALSQVLSYQGSTGKERIMAFQYPRCFPL